MTRLTAPPARVAVVVGVLLFVSYAYFYQAGGWNQNSRFALVRAILESHTLRIDDYQLHTGDKAVWQDHYYSDKPPGTSLMVLPAVEVARWIARGTGVDPGSFPGIAWTSYVAAVSSAGVFTVVAAIAVFMLTIRWGFSTGAALFAALAYGISTPAWSYATLFMSHGVTAGCLMVAFYAAVRMDDVSLERRPRLAAWLGLGCGWAVVTEFQAAIPAGVFFVLAMWRAYRADRASFVRVAGAGVATAAACALVLFTYNTLAFDSPFHLGYASEQGFEHLRTGFFGITYPELWRIRELLIGGYRGVLPFAPLVVAGPVGLILLARDRRRTPWALVALGVAAYYLLLNASYYYWEGGWSYAPRQVTPALPFVALGLAALWDGRSKALRAVLAAGFAWGVAASLVAVSTNPQPSSALRVPMRELLWPSFRDGRLALNTQTFVHGTPPIEMPGEPVARASWNLGEVAGLHGLVSLLPLAIVWIAGLLVLLL